MQAFLVLQKAGKSRPVARGSINKKLRGKQTKQKRRRSSGPRIKHLPRMNISFFAPCFAGLTYALKNEAQPVGHAKNQTEGN
jgi:hypothetical protein